VCLQLVSLRRCTTYVSLHRSRWTLHGQAARILERKPSSSLSLCRPIDLVQQSYGLGPRPICPNIHGLSAKLRPYNWPATGYNLTCLTVPAYRNLTLTVVALTERYIFFFIKPRYTASAMRCCRNNYWLPETQDSGGQCVGCVAW
jgi:hypothetical protein